MATTTVTAPTHAPSFTPGRATHSQSSPPRPSAILASIPLLKTSLSPNLTRCRVSKHLSSYPCATLQRQPSLQLPQSLQRKPTFNSRLARSPSRLNANQVPSASSLTGQLERKLSVTRSFKLERSASAVGGKLLLRLGSSLSTGGGGVEHTMFGGSLSPAQGSINSTWHAVPAPHAHSEHQKKMGIVASAAAAAGGVHAGREAVQRRTALPLRQHSGSWAPSVTPHPEMEEGESAVYFEDTPSMSAALEFDPLALGSSHLMSQLQIQNVRGGVADKVQNAYQGLLKQDWPVFIASLFAAPAALSAVFGVLYMLDPAGLAIDDSVLQYAAPHFPSGAPTGTASVFTFLHAFMMSMSMSTGVDTVVHAVSPFTMLVSQLNGMASQCMFVLLSGAVFARLSQPSQPVLCAEKALICRTSKHRVLATRYVTRHELVDVRIEATLTRTVRSSSGSWTRTEQPLKLVQSGAAYQSEGMLLQHAADGKSPLYGVNARDLKEQDAVLRISVMGLDRGTMGSVFHVEEYKAKDGTLAFAK